MFKVGQVICRQVSSLNIPIVLRRTIMYSLSSINPDEFKSVQYTTKDKVAYITLNRPHVLNAIDENTPREVFQSVLLANDDDRVKVIVLSGKGKAFSSGYDLKKLAETERGVSLASQKMPWDPYKDYKLANACTQAFMGLWKSYKPVICKIHGFCVAGGSDMALCSDIIIMAENAKIGYPPTRVWGCPTTAMWVYRIGAEKAKRMLFTGDLIDGKEAARIGLVLKAVPEEQLDDEVERLAKRMVNVPSNQLFFQKQVINQAVESMGLEPTQRLATLFDGMTRHSPEGVEFQKQAAKYGFKRPVLQRDSGEETPWSHMNSKL
ncbi:putative enoyl-CoA hydratase isoform X1 [Ptychodera flava]|uniref:putative enoyl-CoA hydratase isoform X1 n=2 Tax=Ptychodera flava TaxID=63121 RepID=UPI00396A7113